MGRQRNGSASKAEEKPENHKGESIATKSGKRVISASAEGSLESYGSNKEGKGKDKLRHL